MTRVCGDCWTVLRPDRYEPNTYIDGKCNLCGQYAYVHRVSKAEVVAEIARWNAQNVIALRGGRFVVGSDHGEIEVRYIDE